MCTRGVQPRQRVHQHREERDDDHDRGLRRPVEAEPHHHDRRDADDRQRRYEIADRQQSTPQEGIAMGHHGDEKTGAAADDITRQHAENEGLEKVLPEHPQRAEKSHGDQTRRWKQDGRNPEAAHRDFPQIEHEGAEQQRNGEIDDPRCRLVVRLNGRESSDTEPCGAPIRQHEQPKARSRVTRNGGIVQKRERHGTAEHDASERQPQSTPTARRRPLHRRARPSAESRSAAMAGRTGHQRLRWRAVRRLTPKRRARRRGTRSAASASVMRALPCSAPPNVQRS